MKKFLLVIFLFVSNSIFGQDYSLNKIENALQYQLGLKNLEWIYKVKVNNLEVAKIFNFSNGYAVVSSDLKFYPLKAFSSSPITDTTSEGFKFFLSILTNDYYLQEKFLEINKAKADDNAIAWGKWLSAKSFSAVDTLGPLLSSLYGQVNCHDENGKIINVTNYYTPNNYAVGCVALALTEVLRYYQWPLQGQSSHNYTDNSGSSTGQYEANFEETTYRWDRIQDKYNYVSSTDESRKALGLLAFHAAVSVDMDFENGGSTSNINRVPFAVSHFFRYDSPTYATKSTPGFWELLDQTIEAGDPVQLAISTSSGAGHAIVCDGIIEKSDPSQNYYHLNMGWWGSSNGWYQIRSSFNAGGYTVIDAAVFGLKPVPQLASPAYDMNNNTLDIVWYYPDRIKNPVFELQQTDENNEWVTIADNLTGNSYSVSPDLDRVTKFRIKEKTNTNWSEEVYFNPDDELGKFKTISVYPTLAEDHINVSYKDLKNATVSIYSISGNCEKTVSFGENAGVTEKIDVSALPRGIYMAVVKTNDNIKSFRFVRQGFAQ